MGLLSPASGVPAGEYSLPGLLPEIGGHLFFGFAAGLASYTPGLILLCTAESLLIDFDHLPPMLSLAVQERLSHSVFFIVASALILMLLLSRRGKRGVQIFGVAVAAVLSHLSFDIVAGYGVFPLFFPVSSVNVTLSGYSWIPIELGAIALNLSIFLWSRRASHVY